MKLRKQSAIVFARQHVDKYNTGAKYTVLFEGHVVGSWPMKSNTKMYQMVIEAPLTKWEVLFSVGLKYSH